MSRSFPILAFSLLSLGFSVHAEENKEILPQIVVGVHQFPAGTFKKGTKWQGLFCNNEGCEVKNINVQINKRKEKNVLDEYEAIDDLKFKGDPIALFPKGNFKLGKVQSSYYFNKSFYDFLESEQFKTLKATGKWTMKLGNQSLTLSWVETKDKDEMKYYSYSINDDKTKQNLFTTDIESKYGGEKFPIIHWVGDLDGDGKLDVILSIPDDNCGFDERLYLSSKAEKGKLLKESARIEGSEAACGC
jgi:hypothetical protein